MNIGFIGTRFAGVDGVSLETQKLAQVFRDLGHNCFFCAGELDGNAQNNGISRVPDRYPTIVPLLLRAVTVPAPRSMISPVLVITTW